MAFLLRSTTATSGDAGWTDESGISTSGAPVVLTQRIQLTDLPAAVTTGPTIMAALPANAWVTFASVYVSDAPAGGGFATCRVGMFPDAPGGEVWLDIGSAELAGFASPQWYSIGTGAAAAFDLADGPSIHSARNAGYQITADVNLNTLTNFDVTFYVVYHLIADLTPP